MFEEVTDRVQALVRGDAPDPGANPEGEQETSDPCRSDPPPGGQPGGVAQAGSADDRSGADVRGEEGREYQPGPELPVGDEEASAPLDPSGHPQAEQHQSSRVDDERCELKRRGFAQRPSSETAGSPGRPSALRTARRIASAITSAARAPMRVSSGVPVHAPVASEKTMSPSLAVCAG